jgi:alpha-amylase
MSAPKPLPEADLQQRSEPLRLVLGLHCHQPVGNFGHVFERATATSYRPLLQALLARPGLQFSLHVSGPLCEWWQSHAPGFLAELREGVQAGRIELLTSGLYEPILPVLPRRDRLDQVRLHQDLMERELGARPQALWLTERVWEPSLPADLARCGVRQLPIDDTHFEGAGFLREDLDGVYATEDSGEVVLLLPISAQLRYLVPFQPVEKIEQFLLERQAAGQKLLVFADDAEKFGLWPGTAEWVFEEGWLQQFLDLLERSADWLQVTTLAEAAAALPPVGRVYLPTASYFEMEEWALPVAAAQRLQQLTAKLEDQDLQASARPFLRGATWRSFLVRYPEANVLQQRMVMLSEATEQAGLRPAAGLQRLADLPDAVRALFRGQCNCSYWHGVFGGLYLPFLRDAIVEQLLEARALLPTPALRAELPRVERQDLDADGQEEILLEGAGWSIWQAPHRGGLLEVMDFLPLRRNLTNVLGRREEAYHEQLQTPAEPGEAVESPRSIHDQALALQSDREDLFQYDCFRRGGFALHFLEPGSELQGILRGAKEPLGNLEQVTFEVQELTAAGAARSSLRARLKGDVKVERALSIAENGALQVGLQVTAAADQPLRLQAVWRCDFSFPGCGSDQRYFELPQGQLLVPGDDAEFVGRNLCLIEERGRVQLESSQPMSGHVAPIFTASRSEKGIDTCYQGSCLLLSWALDLAAGESGRWTIALQPLL